MTALVLFVSFVLMLIIGTPIALALGMSGTIAMVMLGNNLVTVPTLTYVGIAKYPLIALPMFVLVGSVFDRSGVAARLVRFATALIGAGRGALASVAVMVAIVMGGISGSSSATSAAIGKAITGSMIRDGYPRSFIAATVSASASIDILIPPSIALIIYSVLAPGVSVPAIFAAGLVPGVLAGLVMLVPIIAISMLKGFGGQIKIDAGPDAESVSLWQSFKDAFWGLMAPVVILGGMRIGAFTPTEAAIIAVFYGLFIGFVIYRTLTWRDVYEMLVEAGELSAIILIVVGLAAIFAWVTSAIGAVDPIAAAVGQMGLGPYGTFLLLMLVLIVVGMFLDGVSIYIILVPILVPIATMFGWNLVWFGIMLTMMVAIGQCTPPLAVSLLVSSKIANTSMESTIKWMVWLLASMFVTLGLVLIFPGLAMWLPDALGY